MYIPHLPITATIMTTIIYTLMRLTTLSNMKNIYAVMLGSIKTEKKAKASRNNGKRGGYWLQERNRHKLPNELNRRYERTIDVDSLINK